MVPGTLTFPRCRRPGCGARRVSRPRLLARPGYCSHRCAALGSGLGVARARALRRQVLARLQALTPLEAFRLGYVRGLQSKCRQIRKRYHLVRID